MEESRDAWGWRQRVRDPRFPACVALLAATALLAAAIGGYDTGALVFAVLLGSGLSLLALPPWQGTAHGPGAGAAVVGGVAALVLAIAWFAR